LAKAMATSKAKAPSTAKRPTSDIPVGTQFSPDLINLYEFLKAVIAHSGDKPELQKATWSPPVHMKHKTVPKSRRRASLPLEAAVQYELLTSETYEATDLAKTLEALPEAQLYDEFGRHIMLKLGGLRVVEACQQMKIDNIPITGDSLARYCTQQGFHVTEHNTAINTMRMWLAKVGIFPERGWEVNGAQKQKITGMSDDTIAELVNLNEAQKAFVRVLCRINPTGWADAADIRNTAEATEGVRIGRGSLPKEVLEPLKQAGLIDYKSGGTSGGKSAKLQTTATFDGKVLTPFIEETVKTLDPGIIAYYRMLPADIYMDLKSTDTYVKGKALEAYAIYIMRALGLHFLGWRKRAKDTTGRAEVDVLLTGLMGVTSTRWQVQCKNTPSGQVDLEDVAKEIGLLPLTHATHVMLIANCSITQDAREFAGEVMRNSSVTIHLLDKKDYAQIAASPAAIGGILRDQAEMFAKQQPKGSIWSIGNK
jgi:hypothetical protein